MRHQRVLNYVNRVRVALGKKPLQKLPKGKRQSFVSCPLSNSFGREIIRVGEGWISFRSVDKAFEIGIKLRKTAFTDGTIALPEYVSKFIDYFDKGMYPELEK